MPDPLSLYRLNLAMWSMVTEAQFVAWKRMAGLAGMWPMSRTEQLRMFAEKGPAFAQAGAGAMAAIAAGRPPQDVAMAALRPIGRRTRANARRLSHH